MVGLTVSSGEVVAPSQSLFTLINTVLLNPLPVPNGLLEPQDVTDSIMHLISDAGRYITGTTYVMDAGFTNKR